MFSGYALDAHDHKETVMPNALELLNHDHREVEQLFAQFESTQDFSIALQICRELTVHAAVEEEIVYPVLAEINEDVEQEAEEEHDDAKELIARIEGMTPDHPGLVATVMKLKGAIEHHVEEEESEAWTEMRKGASDQLDELGRQVEQRKQELLGAMDGGERPPAAPTEVRGRAGADLEDMTRDELYEMAKRADIEGRSSMKKDELKRALTER